MNLRILSDIPLIKAVYPSSSIDKLLLPGEEWVTGRANFHMNFLHGATRRKFISTTTLDVAVCVIWMDSFFHDARGLGKRET